MRRFWTLYECFSWHLYGSKDKVDRIHRAILRSMVETLLGGSPTELRAGELRERIYKLSEEELLSRCEIARPLLSFVGEGRNRMGLKRKLVKFFTLNLMSSQSRPQAALVLLYAFSDVYGVPIVLYRGEKDPLKIPAPLGLHQHGPTMHLERETHSGYRLLLDKGYRQERIALCGHDLLWAGDSVFTCTIPIVQPGSLQTVMWIHPPADAEDLSLFLYLGAPHHGPISYIGQQHNNDAPISLALSGVPRSCRIVVAIAPSNVFLSFIDTLIEKALGVEPSYPSSDDSEEESGS